MTPRPIALSAWGKTVAKGKDSLKEEKITTTKQTGKNILILPWVLLMNGLLICRVLDNVSRTMFNALCGLTPVSSPQPYEVVTQHLSSHVIDKKTEAWFCVP